MFKYNAIWSRLWLLFPIQMKQKFRVISPLLVSEPETYRQSISRADNDRLTRKIGFAAVVAALFFGAISFMILIGVTSIEPTKNVVITTAVVNGVIVSLLLFLISREAFRLLQSRRRGRAAARLHIRIIGLFSLVAAIPAILVAILAGITLDVGLDRWFEIRTKTIVESSVDVANAYLNESYRGLQGATVSMARDLDKSKTAIRFGYIRFPPTADFASKG